MFSPFTRFQGNLFTTNTDTKNTENTIKGL